MRNAYVMNAIERNVTLLLRFAALLAAALCGAALAATDAPDIADIADIEVFVRPGCPRCEEAERFLAVLERERPSLSVSIRDVRADAAALPRLRELAALAGVRALGVPAFMIRGEFFVGYSGPATEARIRALLDRAAPPAAAAEPAAGSCALDEEATACKAEPTAEGEGVDESIDLPWLDMRVGLGDVGLPLFTVVIGLLDGFNPCSMWVLVMMLSMLAGTRDRRKMAAVAGTFVVVQGVAYFAFMAAWLNLFLFIGLSRASEIALGVIALVAGLINVKDFLAWGRGVTLSIPKSAKPGIYERMRRILHEERIPIAIVATVVLAVLVQIVELICTSGFPALYTRILTLRQFDAWSYYGYLLLYNLMYMLDDVIVLGIGVVTLSQKRLQEKEGRALKLIAGVAMLGLGLYLLAAQ